MTQALDGSVTMSSRKGAVVGINVEQLLRRLERNPLAGRGGDFRGGKTPYDELSVNFRSPRAPPPSRKCGSRRRRCGSASSGTSSIPSRDLDLKGTASLLGAADAATTFELPFVVQGPWDDPLVLAGRADSDPALRRGPALLDAVRNASSATRHPQRPRLPGTRSRPAACRAAAGTDHVLAERAITTR